MEMLRKIIGILLIVVAAAVAIHTVVEPLYHASSDAQPYAPLWNILDPIMAVAIVLTVIFGYIRKRDSDASDEGTLSREFVSANTVFFGIHLHRHHVLLELVQPARTGIHRHRLGCRLARMDNNRCRVALAAGRDGYAHVQS